jgi:4-oxalomesaconate tautomerase
MAIPCMLFRGGTSRGPFFRADDLPADPAARDAVLLAALGSPDQRQIDGLGGAHPLTSKVGIVARSARPGVDLEFLFAQVQPEGRTVDTTPNCGNMLAAVLPFALECGLTGFDGEQTTRRVLTLNTGMSCDITVATPLAGGRREVAYAGDAHIDGVPGTASPVAIEFLDTAGSMCGALLPTGRPRDRVSVPAQVDEPAFEVEVTCIDNGMPLVLVRAEDLGRSGRESVAALDADVELKARLERLRRVCGPLMNLGDVAAANVPKMTLLSGPAHGGAVHTRSFIPHVCHDAIGVLAAVTVGAACVLPGTVAQGLAVVPGGTVRTLSIEHPSGEFSVTLASDPADPGRVRRAALLRTARLLMRGEVLVPAAAWAGEVRA